MKKLLLAATGLALVAAFLFLRPPSPPAPAEAIPRVLPLAAPPTAPTPPTNPLPDSARTEKTTNLPLPEASRAAVRECLGVDPTDWGSLARAIEERGGPGARSLQWRVIKTEEDGREIRIRVAREPRESGADSLVVQAFGVDEDGLPDPLPPRLGQKEKPLAWLSDYLKGKPLREDARLEEIALANGGVLMLETDGPNMVEAQFQGPGKGLACSRKGEDPRCRCL